MILCPRALEQYPSNSSLIEEKPILDSKLCGYNSGLLIANYLMATKVVHNTSPSLAMNNKAGQAHQMIEQLDPTNYEYIPLTGLLYNDTKINVSASYLFQ